MELGSAGDLTTVADYTTVQKLFEPDSEGAITVTAYVAGYSSGHTLTVNNSTNNNAISTMTLMEVVAT